MFIAGYWWKVHPGKEAQFRHAWRRGTALIREKYGSLGSRLHVETLEDGSQRFVGIAEWPDHATWQAAFDAKMVYDEPETRAAFVDAIVAGSEGPMFVLEVTDDLLDRASSAN